MRPCFKITASATAEKPTVISVFEDIGFWGTQAKDFIASVNASVSADIHVEINSNGGDVFAALAMYNALRASGKTVTTKVMGIAASAASLVLMAGDKRVMPKNTHVMIHNPSMFVGGNADALDEVAAMLRKIGSSVQATYAARTGMKDEDLATMLATDTWMTADECLANGFATEVVEDIKATASFDMDRADLPANIRAVYMSAQKTPEQIAEETEAAALAAEAEARRVADESIANAQDPAIAQQVSDATAAAGLSAYASVFAVACTSLTEAQARIQSSREIIAICAFAKRPDDAPALIRANKTVTEARSAILTAMADADEHVVTTSKSSTPPAGTAGVSSKNIWQSHNEQTSRTRKDGK